MPDQAEGLRRLFVPETRRMVALVSSGGHDAAFPLAFSLAAALTGQGRRVLLLDEFLSAEDAPPLFGAPLRYDLTTLALAQADIEEAVGHVAPGLDVIAGGVGARLPRPRMEARIGVVNAFYRLAGKYDLVLVNANADTLDSHPSYAWASQDVIVLCRDGAEAPPRIYAQIKLLHQAEDRRFHLLFCGQGRAWAQQIHRNVAAVSRRHLRVMPEDLGLLPQDEAERPEFLAQLADTVLSWPMPERKTGHFPDLMRRLLRGASPRAVQAMQK